MTDPIDLTQLRAEIDPADFGTIEIDGDIVLALIDTAEAARELRAESLARFPDIDDQPHTFPAWHALTDALAKFTTNTST